MRLARALLAGLATVAIAACNDDPISKEVAPEPSAAVRFVNAIADTVAMDYRFVDYPSNASEPSLAFGNSSGNWRIIPSGNHALKAFFTNTVTFGSEGVISVPSLVSTVIDETTAPLETGKKYTILHYGFAKAGATPQKSFKVIEDVLPTVPAGQVAIRVINATSAAINVYSVLATATGGAVSGSPAFSNVAPGAASAWVNFPVATGTQSYRVTATPASATTITADLLANAGAAAVAGTSTTAPLDAVPGTRQATSAMTFVVFGPRVAYTLKSPLTGATFAVAGSSTGSMTTLLDVWPARISP